MSSSTYQVRKQAQTSEFTYTVLGWFCLLFSSRLWLKNMVLKTTTEPIDSRKHCKLENGKAFYLEVADLPVE